MTSSPTMNLRALLTLLAVAVTIVVAWPAAAGAATPSERVALAPSTVRDYWTTKRMQAAEPVDDVAGGAGAAGGLREGSPSPMRAQGSYVPAADPGDPARATLQDGSPGESERVLGLGVVREEVVDPSAPEVRAHGKVFFTIPQGSEAGDYVCSGTAINSRNRSVVWTAGHCVFDFTTGGGFATNWIFVPGYKDEVAPFGEWPARELATTTGWRSSANIRYDLGAAIVSKNALGQRLQEVVGARGIGFDQPRDQLYSTYGYPAVSPPLEFSGEREFRCISNMAGTDQPVGSGPSTTAITCDMTAGSSGGGWVVDSTVLSVTSYGYTIEPDTLYGPYMSASAKDLYRSVRGKKKRRTAGTKGGKGDGKGGMGGKGDGKR